MKGDSESITRIERTRRISVFKSNAMYKKICTTTSLLLSSICYTIDCIVMYILRLILELYHFKRITILRIKIFTQKVSESTINFGLLGYNIQNISS